MQDVASVGDLVTPSPEEAKTSTERRRDGRAVMHFDNTDSKVWWCWICGWGRNMRQTVASKYELYEQWDAHKATPAHQAEVSAREHVDAVVDVLEQGDS